MDEGMKIPEDLKFVYADAKRMQAIASTSQYSPKWIAELIEQIATLRTERDEARRNFKNFHERLCERFGYSHDEQDWKRDQASLIEHIASQIATLKAMLDESAKENKRLREQMYSFEDELEKAQATLEQMQERYAIPENQALCIGYAGGCDGDLVAAEHNDNCPAKAKDVELRSYLYASRAQKAGQ